MAQVLADLVLETTAVTGTGTLTLLGAKSGHFSFGSSLSNGDQCVYCITDYVDVEVVEGVYSSNTLTRVTVKQIGRASCRERV